MTLYKCQATKHIFNIHRQFHRKMKDVTANMAESQFLCARIGKEKQDATKTLLPFSTSGNASRCTLMLLTNLAQVEWIFVPCKAHLLTRTICARPKEHLNNNETQLIVVQDSSCHSYQILLDKKCFLFLWRSRSNHTTMHSICGDSPSDLEPKQFYGVIIVVSEAISVPFHPVLMQTSDSQSMNVLTYPKLLNNNRINTHPVSVYQAEGFQICERGQLKLKKGDNIFQCHSGQYVHHIFVCDAVPDCGNHMSDETIKECKNFPKYQTNFMELRRNLKQIVLTVDHMSSFGFFPERNAGVSVSITDVFSKANFKCSNKKVIHLTLMDDLVSDCNLGGDDEPTLVDLLANEHFQKCAQLFQLPCVLGHSKCYNVSDICLYKLNKFNRLEPCSNGGHMQNCGSFECNRGFKCSSSYCIPWGYVCDKKWDCPDAEDELEGVICNSRSGSVCKNMFKCRQSKTICTKLTDLCDGNKDCPFGEDEFLCDLNRKECPTNCTCFFYTIECKLLEALAFERFIPCYFVSVTYSTSLNMRSLISQLKNANVLKFSHNQLSSLCSLTFPPEVKFLDIGFNFIKELQKCCFKGMLDIRKIALPFNHISSIETDSFHSASKLNILDISSNPLSSKMFLFLNSLSQLKHLILNNVSLQELDFDLFSELNLPVVSTTHYQLCCILSGNTTCFVRKGWFEICSRLLFSKKIAMYVIVIALFVFSGNIISSTLHKTITSGNKVFIFLAVSPNLSSFLCSIHLWILSAADNFFQDSFVLKGELWMTSIGCFSTFAINIWGILLSSLLVLVMNFCRMMVVLHPVTSKCKKFSQVSKWVCMLLVMSLGFSLSVTAFVSQHHGKVSNHLCLPFVEHGQSILIVRVTTFLTAAVLLISALTVFVMNKIMVQSLKTSQENLQKSKSHTTSSIVVQLCILSTSNVICWWPPIFADISTVFLPSFSLETIALVTFVCAPINGIVYPVVLTAVLLKKGNTA